MTMNLNTLVLENIIQSTYYKNYLNEVTTFQQVSDEVYYNVLFFFCYKNFIFKLYLFDLGCSFRTLGTRHS